MPSLLIISRKVGESDLKKSDNMYIVDGGVGKGCMRCGREEGRWEGVHGASRMGANRMTPSAWHGSCCDH